MPTIRKERREVPINYQSERINKQISSLPDILIKLKTETNSVLEAPLVVEYISITNWATINLHPCRVSFSLDFSPGIAHSTHFKPNTAFTCAELRLLVSAKVRNNVGTFGPAIFDILPVPVEFYRFCPTDRHTSWSYVIHSCSEKVISWVYTGLGMGFMVFNRRKAPTCSRSPTKFII